MAICKIYDFKYVTYALMRFIKAWSVNIGKPQLKF